MLRAWPSVLYVMSRLFIFSLVMGSLHAHAQSEEKKEQFKYKLKLGWFAIGSGEVSIESEVPWKGIPCYKVSMHAKTLGLGNWLGSLDDYYVSMIDRKKIKPLCSEKNVTSSNNSRQKQWSTFHYDSMRVDVKMEDHKRNPSSRAWQVKIEQNTQDVLGTFIFFKHYDWSTMHQGDSLMLTTFYEAKLYPVGVRFMGKESVAFNDRKVAAYRLHLLLPEHENIRKDRPIVIWITADKNRYPLRVQTRLPFLGRGLVELVELNGVEL